MVQTIQVGQFKSDFSSILNKVQKNGEKYIIEYGKKHKKVAMLIPYNEEKKQRVFGLHEGKSKIDDNFDDENENINSMFYGL